MVIYFSNTVQVKLNLLEKLHLKIYERKTKAGLCKRFFDFYRPGILKRAFEVIYMQYITLGLG